MQIAEGAPVECALLSFGIQSQYHLPELRGGLGKEVGGRPGEIRSAVSVDDFTG